MPPLPKEKLLETLAELSSTDLGTSPRTQVSVEQYMALIEEVLELRDKVERIGSMSDAIMMLGKKIKGTLGNDLR